MKNKSWKSKYLDPIKEEHRHIYGQPWSYGLDHYNFLKPYLFEGNRKTFLDLGCGALRTGIHVIPHVAIYVGIDSSSESLKCAEYEIKMNHLDRGKIRLIHDSDFKIKALGKYDIIFASSILQHLSEVDLKKAIRLIRHCMHKDSLLLVNTKLPFLVQSSFGLKVEELQESELIPGLFTKWFILGL